MNGPKTPARTICSPRTFSPSRRSGCVISKRFWRGRRRRWRHPTRPAGANCTSGAGLSRAGRRLDTDATAVAVVEHDAVGEGEERVVAAKADVVPRVDLRAALTHENAARADALAGVHLHAQMLRI